MEPNRPQMAGSKRDRDNFENPDSEAPASSDALDQLAQDSIVAFRKRVQEATTAQKRLSRAAQVLAAERESGVGGETTFGTDLQAKARRGLGVATATLSAARLAMVAKVDAYTSAGPVRPERASELVGMVREAETAERQLENMQGAETRLAEIPGTGPAATPAALRRGLTSRLASDLDKLAVAPTAASTLAQTAKGPAALTPFEEANVLPRSADQTAQGFEKNPSQLWVGVPNLSGPALVRASNDAGAAKVSRKEAIDAAIKEVDKPIFAGTRFLDRLRSEAKKPQATANPTLNPIIPESVFSRGDDNLVGNTLAAVRQDEGARDIADFSDSEFDTDLEYAPAATPADAPGPPTASTYQPDPSVRESTSHPWRDRMMRLAMVDRYSPFNTPGVTKTVQDLAAERAYVAEFVAESGFDTDMEDSPAPASASTGKPRRTLSDMLLPWRVSMIKLAEIKRQTAIRNGKS